MSLHDIVIPSKRVVITQAFDERPEVALTVFGLTTSDFVILSEAYSTVLATIFLGNAKSELSNIQNSTVIMKEFPMFGATCIACGCKQPDAVDHVANMPVMIQAELLATVFSLTFPDGLKKSLEKLAPIIAPLLKK